MCCDQGDLAHRKRPVESRAWNSVTFSWSPEVVVVVPDVVLAVVRCRQGHATSISSRWS